MRRLLFLLLIGAPAFAANEDCSALFVSSFVGGPYQSRIDLDTSTLHSLPLNDLEGAESLACGPDGLVYVGLSGGQPMGSTARQIVRYDQEGKNLEVVLDWATAPALVDSGGPEGLTFAPNGDLFFATRRGGTAVLLPSGVWRLAAGSSTPIQVMEPFTQANAEATALLTKGPFAGHLLAADYSGNRIMRVAPPFDGPQTPVEFITGVSCPNGLAVSAEGDLYVANECRGTIERFASDGGPKGVFVSGAQELRKLTFDPSGNLYAASVEGPVYRFAPDGGVTVLADVHEGNGVGVCPRPDSDGDGVCNARDNCADSANADQSDSDGDGVGNLCEPKQGCGCASTDGAVLLLAFVTMLETHRARAARSRRQ